MIKLVPLYLKNFDIIHTAAEPVSFSPFSSCTTPLTGFQRALKNIPSLSFFPVCCDHSSYPHPSGMRELAPLNALFSYPVT